MSEDVVHALEIVYIYHHQRVDAGAPVRLNVTADVLKSRVVVEEPRHGIFFRGAGKFVLFALFLVDVVQTDESHKMPGRGISDETHVVAHPARRGVRHRAQIFYLQLPPAAVVNGAKRFFRHRSEKVTRRFTLHDRIYGVVFKLVYRGEGLPVRRGAAADVRLFQTPFGDVQYGRGISSLMELRDISELSFITHARLVLDRHVAPDGVNAGDRSALIAEGVFRR